MTLDDASTYLMQHTSSGKKTNSFWRPRVHKLRLYSPTDWPFMTREAYQRMLASNWSFGIERDPEQIKLNDDDPTKWTNPLETRLPDAPSMRIFCLYGHGKPTERRSAAWSREIPVSNVGQAELPPSYPVSYFYREDGFDSDDERIDGEPFCAPDSDCTNITATQDQLTVRLVLLPQPVCCYMNSGDILSSAVSPLCLDILLSTLRSPSTITCHRSRVAFSTGKGTTQNDPPFFLSPPPFHAFSW
jgi:hypothetical protein